MIPKEEMTKLVKTTTGILGVLTLVPGLAKFSDPFKTMFTVQIAKSELPIPAISFWLGQLGEITVGLLLLGLVFSWRRIPPLLAGRFFYLGNMMVALLMVAAVYVHQHPDVPANVLPFAHKAPFLAVVMLYMAGFNLHWHRTATAHVHLNDHCSAT